MDALGPLLLAAAFLGACVGSFLNVVIYRLPRGLSVAQPARSFCPSCREPIPWHRNVPLLTWLLQGRCGSCRVRIPARYFVVEFATTALFALLAGRALATAQGGRLDLPTLGVELVAAALFVAIAVIDFEFAIIPDPLTVPWIAACVAAAAVAPGIPFGRALDPTAAPLAALALAGAGLGAFPALVADFLRREREVVPEGAEPESALPRPDEEFSLLAETREFLAPLLLPALAGAVALPLLLRGADFGASPRLAAVLTAAAGAGAGMLLLFGVRFVFSALFRREAMGLGDAKFLGLAGALLGAEGALATFALACFLGALPAFGSLLRRLPLATVLFLAFATLPLLLVDPLARAFSPAAALGVATVVMLAALVLFLRRLRASDVELKAMPFGPFLALAAIVLLLAWEPIFGFLRARLAAPH